MSCFIDVPTSFSDVFSCAFFGAVLCVSVSVFPQASPVSLRKWFCADAGQHAEFSGKCTDDVTRCVDGDADNGNAFFPVWQSHPSDDVFPVPDLTGG